MEELEEIPTKKSKKNAIIVSVVSVILVILIIVVCTLCIILKTFIVDGNSMLPTLNGGVYQDFTDGDKVVINKVKKIKRGNIVVATINGETIIKRVVALPNDKVKIKDGILYVNGKKEDTSKLSSDNKIMSDSDKEITLKTNMFFLLGDNRAVSKDSRIIGAVSKDNIEGVAVFVIQNKKLKLAKDF